MAAEAVSSEGALHIVTGCMFSGKSERLLSAANRCAIDRRLVAGPLMDTRSIEGGAAVVCRSGTVRRLDDAVSVRSLECLRSHERYANVTHVFVDEAQFFEHLATDVLRMVYVDGKHVMLAGLVSDWRCRPFGELSLLLPHANAMEIADGARCAACGARALYTVARHETDQVCSQVQVGDTDTYSAVCGVHYHSPRDDLRKRREMVHGTTVDTVYPPTSPIAT